MRSLHSAKDTKIFRFHDFTEERPETTGNDGLISPKIPFLSFEDESYKDRQEKKEPAGGLYLNFGDEAVNPKTGMLQITEVPYLTFGDEDFNFRKGDDLPVKKPEVQISEEPVKPEEPKMAVKQPEIKSVIDYSKEMAEKIINDAEREAKDIMEKSGAEAKAILDEANKEGADIRATAAAKAEKLLIETEEEAYKAGYEKGLIDGSKEGRAQALAASKEKFAGFFKGIDEACGTIDARKEEVLQQGLKDLTDLSLAISEKVISTALDTCGDVTKRMILAAAAEASEKQWAKVTISAKDARLMEEEGINIGNELYLISDKIDLIIVDDATSGTCFIEFPDQAIDASASTQLKNIKTALHEA